MYYTPSEADEKKVESSFTYHPPHDDQVERYRQIRDQAKYLALLLIATCHRVESFLSH